MGLDISAYSEIREQDLSAEQVEERWPEKFTYLYINPDFSERATGLRDGAYSYEESLCFTAGSYGGYNDWREKLAALAGYPSSHRAEDQSNRHDHSAGAWQSSGGPFYELIHFSDCEGVMCSSVCAKLLGDFREYRERAEALGDEWFLRKYIEWTRAFELAANSGAVEFH